MANHPMHAAQRPKFLGPLKLYWEVDERLMKIFAQDTETQKLGQQQQQLKVDKLEKNDSR